MICKFCKKEFVSEKWRDRKYCSRECYRKDQKGNVKWITIECENCGKEVVYKNRKQRFCSVDCRQSFMKGKKHGSYKGGTILRKFRFGTPYVVIRGERSNGGGEMFKHRKIAEKALERPFKKGEVVHHINCDSLDNRNENLLICSSSYHAWLHKEMGTQYAKRFLDTKQAVHQHRSITGR